MPLKLAKSDRRLLIWTGAFLLLIIVALAFFSPEGDSGVPSTYSAQSSGAKAAYLLLQDEGYSVERWERPPSELPEAASHTVLVLASPFRFPSPSEKNALLAYLSHGGKILATGSTAELFLPQAETVPEPLPAPSWKEYQPQLLTSLTRGGAIQMSPTAYWDRASTSYLAHYADTYSDSTRPIVVSYNYGRGHVIWWAASTPLSNAGISLSGNMALMLNSLGQPGEVHVFWDEYFHGSRASVGAYIWERPVLFGLLQCALVLLALVLTYSRRHGPIYPADEPSRLSPLEFVETVGGLYRRAHHTRPALEVSYARFRLQAARQLGLSAEVPAADLARAIRSRLNYKDDSLQDLLRDIEAAMYDPELSEAKTLELVQQLSLHARTLLLISYQQKETFSHAGNIPGARPRTN